MYSFLKKGRMFLLAIILAFGLFSATENVNAETRSVGTWDDYRTAISDSNVDVIELTNNISAGTAPANLQRSLTINGNGYEMNFAARTQTLVAPTGNVQSVLKLNDVKITGTSNIFSSSNTNAQYWTVEVDNVSSLAGNTATFLDTTTTPRGGGFLATGNFTWDVTGTSMAMRVANFEAKNSADVKITGERYVVVLEGRYATEGRANLKITEGAQVSVSNLGNRTSDTTAIYINSSSAEGSSTATIDILGAGSKLYVYSNGADTATNGATFIVQGVGAEINIKDGGVFEGLSTRQSVIISQNLKGKFNVDGEGSLLKLTTESDNGYERAAALRFRLRGGQEFNITNKAKVEINQLTAAKSGDTGAPGVRFYGAGNVFNVSGGSIVTITNHGNKTYQNPGGNGRNQGVHYDGSNSNFYINDDKSAVEIVSKYGSAIDME